MNIITTADHGLHQDTLSNTSLLLIQALLLYLNPWFYVSLQDKSRSPSDPESTVRSQWYPVVPTSTHQAA